MRLWDAFYPDVLPFIDQMTAPRPVVNAYLLRAAQQFCRDTRAWHVALEPVQTKDLVTEYDLELPPASELVRIESATMNAVPLAVWRQDATGSGQYVYTPDGKRLLLKQAPGEGAQISIQASLAPANDATGVEDFLFDRYAEVIAQGAVSRANGDVAGQQAFIERCIDVRADAWRGFAATTPRARASWM